MYLWGKYVDNGRPTALQDSETIGKTTTKILNSTTSLPKHSRCRPLGSGQRWAWPSSCPGRWTRSSSAGSPTSSGTGGCCSWSCPCWDCYTSLACGGLFIPCTYVGLCICVSISNVLNVRLWLQVHNQAIIFIYIFIYLYTSKSLCLSVFWMMYTWEKNKTYPTTW